MSVCVCVYAFVHVCMPVFVCACVSAEISWRREPEHQITPRALLGDEQHIFYSFCNGNIMCKIQLVLKQGLQTIPMCVCVCACECVCVCVCVCVQSVCACRTCVCVAGNHFSSSSSASRKQKQHLKLNTLIAPPLIRTRLMLLARNFCSSTT